MPLSAQVLGHFPATSVFTVDPFDINDQLLMETIVPVLKGGDIVAIPTETVYGLAGNALDSSAVSKIFEAKGRPSDNPLIVHISNLDQLKRLIAPGSFPEEGSLKRKLCDTFWPGPLTLLFPKGDKVPHNVTAGQDQIAVRMPSHPIARRIIELSDTPLAAPSANKSGKPSPTCAEHVLLDLGRRAEPSLKANEKFEFGKGAGVGYIVDGGNCEVGVESTVVRVEDYQVLRPGTVTVEQLQAIDERFELFSLIKKLNDGNQTFTKEEELSLAAPATPGLKYKHYSPSVPVVLFEFMQPWEDFQNKINMFIKDKMEESPGTRIGILRVHEDLKFNESEHLLLHTMGSTDQPETVAHNLFASFRHFDKENVDLIIMEGVREKEEGMAVMNRARKASSVIL